MEEKNETSLAEIGAAAAAAARELIEIAQPEAGDIFVIGCSSSEILGERIGHGSSPDAAKAVFEAVYPIILEHGLYLAAQCCEHLNRALVMEKAAAKEYGYPPVNVRPQIKAGGSFATTAFAHMEHPVVVEAIHHAGLGLDIGDTFIGMHFRPVVVPVRLTEKQIGCAHLTAARSRAKYIGGERAVYQPELK